MLKQNVNFRDSKNLVHVDNEKTSVRLLVNGKVQGVYFRLNMQEIAKKNSVFGWVRNLTDGRVEALLEGNKDGVDQVIEWSKKGPENARVDDLKIDYLQYEGKFVDFVIQHDESQLHHLFHITLKINPAVSKLRSTKSLYFQLIGFKLWILN